MTTIPTTPPPIMVGRVNLRQDVAGGPLVVTHNGKLGVTHAELDPRQLEKWLLRVLREKAFT